MQRFVEGAFSEEYKATMLRVPSFGLTALEWAAKKGNLDVIEWLCTDVRTKALVRTGSPIGWACYTGRVECAKSLLRHGADPTATDAFLWDETPPLLVAFQNGQLEAKKEPTLRMEEIIAGRMYTGPGACSMTRHCGRSLTRTHLAGCSVCRRLSGCSRPAFDARAA